jgi:hypothetical protein
LILCCASAVVNHARTAVAETVHAPSAHARTVPRLNPSLASESSPHFTSMRPYSDSFVSSAAEIRVKSAATARTARVPAARARTVPTRLSQSLPAASESSSFFRPLSCC